VRQPIAEPRTFRELIDAEHALAVDAPARYGAHYEVAAGFDWLLGNFPKSVSHDRDMFVRWLSQVTKHHRLALLSTLRLHQVQAGMNLRQVIESGTMAAYYLANPTADMSLIIDDDGLVQTTPKLRKLVYDWLSNSYPQHSAALKGMKDQISNTQGHAYLANTHNNFSYDTESGFMRTPFFDADDDYLVGIRLWENANVAHCLLDLLCAVTDASGGLELIDDFGARFLDLERHHRDIEQAYRATDRFKKAIGSGPPG
jgi:hypothetical protein